jgi:Sulfotransferase domain
MTPPRLLALWSAPRSRSTAFLRMMVERGDYAVLHEPFSHLADFGAAAVGGQEVRTEAGLMAALVELSGQTPVFFKDTTDFRYPGLLGDAQFLRAATHTFLLRDPAQAIASHFALNPGLERDDVGFARLSEIYDAVAQATGRPPVVLSSDDLMADPEPLVRAYCQAVGLPPRAEALTWQPGMLAQWQRTSRWHEATSRTAGFAAAPTAYARTVDNDPVLAAYLDYHLPFFRRLHDHRLRPAPAAGHSGRGRARAY